MLVVAPGCAADLAQDASLPGSASQQSSSYPCEAFEQPALDYGRWGYFEDGSRLRYELRCREGIRDCRGHYEADIRLKTLANQPIDYARVYVNLAFGEHCNPQTREALSLGWGNAWGTGALPMRRVRTYVGEGDASGVTHFEVGVQLPKASCIERLCIEPYVTVAKRYLLLRRPVWEESFDLSERR